MEKENKEDREDKEELIDEEKNNVSNCILGLKKISLQSFGL